MATSNKIRALNRLPFDFEDGLKVSGVDLGGPSGSSKVGYDDGTVEDVLDNAVSMTDYTDLRAYTGRATSGKFTAAGIAGPIYRDDADTTTPDNGGTVWRDNLGRAWKRLFVGPMQAKWFGAMLNGVADDAAAVNSAIASAASAGIGEVHFSGVMGIASGLLARSGVTLVGDGWSTSKIKALTGFSGNIYETYNFAAVQLAQLTDTEAGCPISYGLENCTVDGNWQGTASATAGYGVRLYGRQLRLKRLLIGNVPGIGLYTEFSTSAPYVQYNSLTDTKFSTIRDVEILEVGKEGFVFFGPTDQFLDNIFVGWPAGSRYENYDTTGPKTSDLFPGEPIHGVRIQRTAEIGFMHSHDNDYGVAVYVQRKAGDAPVRLRASYLMGENAYGGIYIGPDVRYQISLLETHTNRRGPSSAGPYAAQAGVNPHVEIDSTLGGGAKIDIFREGDERACDGLYVSGFEHSIDVQVFALTVDFTGGGKGVVNNAISSRIKADIVSKEDTNRLTIGYEETSIAASNDLDIRTKFCNTNINFLGGAGSDTGTKYKLNSERAATSGINNLARLSSATYLSSEIHAYDGTSRRRNKWQSAVSVDFSVTGLQTLSIPYGAALVRDPMENEVQLTVSYDTGTLPPIVKLAVINIDTVNKEIDVGFECTGGATGAGKINVRVG